MPMIDVDLPEGLIPTADHARLAHDLGLALIAAEGHAAEGPILDHVGVYVHVLPTSAVHTIATPSAPVVRVRLTTAPGGLDRAGQRRAVADITRLIAAAGDDDGLTGRTWVIHSEATEGGWGTGGIAMGKPEFAAASSAQH